MQATNLKREGPQMSKAKVLKYTEPDDGWLPITAQNIETAENDVLASDNYGKESLIIRNVLKAFPQNKDLNLIAMKIAVIDVTNSTHLSQYKSIVSLYDIANRILNIGDFDDRLRQGDPELVPCIANFANINLFSFASKYCTYHSVEVYGQDHYSIYDGVVKNVLPHYVKGLSAFQVERWRQQMNYKAFNDCLGRLLDENHIDIKLRRRKLDHFLWYQNREWYKAKKGKQDAK